MHPKIEDGREDLIEMFNSRPKDGIYLIKKLLEGIEGVVVEEEIAEFFIKEKQNLDLENLGEFLSEDATFFKLKDTVLGFFSSKLDLKGNFTEDLRTFLKAFRLPGEANKIDRLMKGFGKSYMQNPKLTVGNVDAEYVDNAEAAYYLAYAVIMLNTDAHNPNVPKKDKMTFAGFKNILVGFNNGKDFESDFLKKIYEDIQRNPFEVNLIKVAPGFQLNSKMLNKDPLFKKMDSFLQSKITSQDTFPEIGSDVKVEVEKPKSWLNTFLGYKGTISFKYGKARTPVTTVQVYEPGLFSKWILGEEPKVIIQPVHQKKVDFNSRDLAAKIAAGFKTEATIKSTFNYESNVLSKAYNQYRQKLQLDVSKEFSNHFKQEKANQESPKTREEWQQWKDVGGDSEKFYEDFANFDIESQEVEGNNVELNYDVESEHDVESINFENHDVGSNNNDAELNKVALNECLKKISKNLATELDMLNHRLNGLNKRLSHSFFPEPYIGYLTARKRIIEELFHLISRPILDTKLSIEEEDNILKNVSPGSSDFYSKVYSNLEMIITNHPLATTRCLKLLQNFNDEILSILSSPAERVGKSILERGIQEDIKYELMSPSHKRQALKTHAPGNKLDKGGVANFLTRLMVIIYGAFGRKTSAEKLLENIKNSITPHLSPKPNNRK